MEPLDDTTAPELLPLPTGETTGPGPKPKPLDVANAELLAGFSRQSKAEQKNYNTGGNLLDLVASRPMSTLETEGARRYTDSGQTYFRGRDNEAVAAGTQGFWNRAVNTTKGFWYNLAGSVGAFTQFPVAATKSMLSLLNGEGLDTATNKLRGEEGSWLKGINQWSDAGNEQSINYQSGWAKENPGLNLIPLAGEGGDDFGSLTRSAGFIVGGVATSLAENMIGAALAPETGGLSLLMTGADTAGKLARAFKGMGTIGKNLDTLSEAVATSQKAEKAMGGLNRMAQLGKLWSGIDTPIGELSTRSALHGLLVSNGEASLEGYHTEKETYNSLVAAHREQYGSDPSAAQQARFRELAKTAGNTSFLWNQGLLAVSNKFQVDTILKNFKGTRQFVGDLSEDLFTLSRKEGSATFGVERAGKQLVLSPNDTWYQKAFKVGAYGAQKVGTAGILGISDGLEEQFQKAIGDGTQRYFMGQYSSAGEGDRVTTLQAATHGLGQAFGTAEGWGEFLAGLVTAGGFGGGIRWLTDRLNEPRIKAELDRWAGVMNTSPEVLAELAIKQLNTTLQADSLLGKVAVANGVQTTAQLGVKAAKAGDQLLFENLQNSAQFRFLRPFVLTQSGDVLTDQLKTFEEDIHKDPVAFARDFGLDESLSSDKLLKLVNTLRTDYTTLQQSHDRFSLLFQNPYTNKALTPETAQQAADWNEWYSELLHTDFLRKQYTSRIGKLSAKTSTLGTDLPYTSPEGWEAHKQKAADELARLDSALSVLERDTRAGYGDDKTGLDAELNRVRNGLLAEQKETRQKLTQRIKLVDDVQKAGFGKLDTLLDTIEADLALDRLPGTAVPTRTELSETLQQAFDAQLLKAAVDKLGDLLNRYTTSNGISHWKKEKEGFLAEQAQTRQTELDRAKRSLKARVLEQFRDKADAEFHLGDLTTYLDSKLAGSSLSLDELTGQVQADSQTAKAQKKADADKLEAGVQLLTELLGEDTHVRLTTDPTGADPGGKKLGEVIRQTLLEAPAADPFSLQTDVLNNYLTQFPRSSQPKSTELSEVPAPTNEASLTDEGSTTPPAEPTAPVVALTDSGGSLINKLYQTGMYLEPDGRGGLKTGFMSRANRYVDGTPQNDFDDPVKQQAWDTLVQARYELDRQVNGLETKTPAELLTWSVETVSDPVRYTPLPMERALARKTAGQYLVARLKDQPDGPTLITIPFEDTLYLSSEGAYRLEAAGFDISEADTRRPFAQVLAGPQGAELYRFLASNVSTYPGQEGKPLLAVVDTYADYLEAATRFTQTLAGLQQAYGQGGAALQEAMAPFRFFLAQSGPAETAARSETVLDEVVGADFLPGKKLLVRLKKTGDGLQLTHVKGKTLSSADGTQTESNLLTERDFTALQENPTLWQTLTDPQLWNGWYAGTYLIARDRHGHLFPYKLTGDPGLTLLQTKLASNDPLTGTTGFYFTAYTGDTALQGELDLFQHKDGYVFSYTPQNETTTYYSKPFTKTLQQRLVEEPTVADSSLVQDELNRMLATLQYTSKGTTTRPAQLPTRVSVFYNDPSAYGKQKVAMKGKSVWKRVDVNWQLPLPQVVADEPTASVADLFDPEEVPTVGVADLFADDESENQPTVGVGDLFDPEEVDTEPPTRLQTLVKAGVPLSVAPVLDNLLNQTADPLRTDWEEILATIPWDKIGTDETRLRAVRNKLTYQQTGTLTGSTPSTRLDPNRSITPDFIQQLIKDCHG